LGTLQIQHWTPPACCRLCGFPLWCPASSSSITAFRPSSLYFKCCMHTCTQPSTCSSTYVHCHLPAAEACICTMLHTQYAAEARTHLLDGHGQHSISFVVDVLAYQVHPPCSKTPALCMQPGGTDAHSPSEPCYSAAGLEY
jgi:hypothetical protein